MRCTRRLALAFVATAALAGCSGSGGSTSTASPRPATPATRFSPPTPHRCELAHGAEGGGPLPYTAKGLNCTQALPVLQAVLRSPANCATACAIQGFTCRLVTPPPVQPGSRITCVAGANELDVDLPG